MKTTLLATVLLLCTNVFAHSGENFVESDLFGNLGVRDKAAILVVHFGTSYDDTRAATIDVLNQAMREAFPGIELREAWTSRIIIRKLERERGIRKENPTQALIRLHEEGYTHILVQSSNIIEGTEMKELRREVESLSLNFKDIRVGAPLLYAPGDYAAVVNALIPAVRAEQFKGQILLVGHGTPDPATASYAMLDYMLKADSHPDCHVGTVEGYPAFADALRLMKKQPARTVTLVPLMFVAGDHARNDIAGDWKAQLEEQGFRVNLYLKGLGENPAIRQLFVDHARFAAHHKLIDMAAKKQGYASGKTH